MDDGAVVVVAASNGQWWMGPVVYIMWLFFCDFELRTTGTLEVACNDVRCCTSSVQRLGERFNANALTLPASPLDGNSTDAYRGLKLNTHPCGILCRTQRRRTLSRTPQTRTGSPLSRCNGGRLRKKAELSPWLPTLSEDTAVRCCRQSGC